MFMQITIEVNNKKLRAEKGETILSALNRNGINIPTLCRLEGLSPTGACRLCVVEVEGEGMLVTACSEPVKEWMKIRTHSPRVIRARKAIVELLLSNHPDNCLYCDRNLACELQDIAYELNIRERRLSSDAMPVMLDQSSPAITRDLSKCILCGRCVRICEEVMTINTLGFIGKGRGTHIGTTMDKDFNFSSCIHCGQCVNVCPTGAMHERYNVKEVQDYLDRDDMLKVVQYSSLVARSIAEELGMKYSTSFEEKLNEAFTRLGFDRVYSTGFGSDVLITELSEQLAKNKSKKSGTTVFTSHCPAWVKFAEQTMEGVLDKLSGLKSPQQVTGAVIKALVPQLEKVEPEQIYSVSVTACTAAKYDARRDDNTRKGISDIETVLTVREMIRLLRLYGIDINMLDGRHADEPFNLKSSCSLLTSLSGGLAESVIRVLSKRHGIELSPGEIRKLRTGGSFREITLGRGKLRYNFAIVNGLKALSQLEEKQKTVHYDLVEVMACNSGCVRGGGMDGSEAESIVKERISSICKSSKANVIKLPGDNPSIRNFYDRWIPGNADLADRKILMNSYSKKDVLL